MSKAPETVLFSYLRNRPGVIGHTSRIVSAL